MLSRLTTSALLCLGLIVASALPAAASQDDRPDYLALGDSVAFGYREQLPPEVYLNPNNFVGYPERLAQLLNLRLTNAACPGEATGSFISATSPDNGCREYRTFFPLHTSYTGTQLAFAIAFLRAHPDTKLVTIDLGANDLFQIQAGCQGSAPCVLQQLPMFLQSAAGNLNTIYARLRSDAGYRGRLVALTYYATNYRDVSQVEVVSALDVTIAAATLAHAGRVADGFTAFALASLRTQGNVCAAGLLNILPNGTCDVHPSLAGHDLLARTIRAVATY
jgi:lysophospholipase L1-like esterase